jgi:hypothetical protein
MRSKQSDTGASEEPDYDHLERAVADAMNERYTAAQKGNKTLKAPAKKPTDVLEHQAKIATTERPVYAQKGANA